MCKKQEVGLPKDGVGRLRRMLRCPDFDGGSEDIDMDVDVMRLMAG